MKKILILDTGREWGGGTNSLLEFVKRADRSRYSFTALFYDNYKKGGVSDVKTELEKYGCPFLQLPRVKTPLRAKALKEAARAFFFYKKGIKKDFIFFADYNYRVVPDSKRIAAILRDKGFDLLYMNNQPSSNLEGILGAEEAGVRCIQHARVEVALNSVEAAAVNKHVDRVICVSKGVKAGLVKSGVDEGKCVVVPNGIDPDMMPGKTSGAVRRELPSSEEIGAGDGFVIGTAGSLIKRKRIELLLEAVALLKNEVIKCIIAGDGPEMSSLKKKAAGLGVKDKVFFTGFSADALSYINAMDVFVLPSSKEGFARVVLEAMLMAKPVVAFDVAGIREQVVDGETGIIVKEERASALAAAVLKFASDKALIKRYGEAGRVRVIDNFTVAQYVEGVSSVLEEVLSAS
ncbi:MAG: glycosyltransferase family 4 protein [Deltaproteobacteria bacterium]|nr:glycosyltransferase family 4 protein [Deltaproteobacteria bacterium]